METHLVFSDSTQGNDSYGSGGVWEIDDGWDVFGSDGEKIGDVHDVQSHYIVVSKGFFFPSEKYIPVSAISNVENDRVYLNVGKNEIDSMGWDQVPAMDTTSYTDVDTTTYTDTTPATMTTGTTSSVGTTDMVDDDDVRVQLAEEQLRVQTHQVQRGIVRVRKGVVTEEQTINVPVREEQVHIERHAVDGTYTGQVPANAFQETEIEIPIRGEEVDVTKQAFIREEVEIDKDVVEHTERVTDTVRREEVYIEGADQGLTGTTGTTGTTGYTTTETTGTTGTRGVSGSGDSTPGGIIDRVEDALGMDDNNQQTRRNR